jgi:hypothetical protein
MNEVLTRGTAGHQWREVAPLTTRVPGTLEPVEATEARYIDRGGEPHMPQRLADFDGVVRTVTLPVREGAGQWRAIVEDGRRLYAFQRQDGSRSVVCLD